MRILFIRTGQLGDTIFASSIIDPLLRKYGDFIKIDCVTKYGIGNIFSRDPRIHKIYGLKDRKLPLILNPGKLSVLIGSIKHPYDLAINLETGTILNGLMRMIRAKQKIGMPYHSFLGQPDTHAVENYRKIYRTFLSEEFVRYATPSLQAIHDFDLRNKFGLKDNYVIFAASNSHYNRKSGINHRAWPIHHWGKLLKSFDDTGIQGVLIGNKGEQKFIDKLNPLPASILSLVGKTSLPELIKIIENAKCIVTTDSGPSHLAAAVNTPVIVLIGPTNFKRTGPYQTDPNRIDELNVNLPCSPCYHSERKENCSDNKCMSQILPYSVLEKIRSYLD